jgi:hypothetical protein
VHYAVRAEPLSPRLIWKLTNWNLTPIKGAKHDR